MNTSPSDVPTAADSKRSRLDAGQATSEYALVMLAAALIALLAIGWATSGGGAGRIGQMFDRVLEDVTNRIP